MLYPLLVWRSAPHNQRIKPTPGGKACDFPARRGLFAAPLGPLYPPAPMIVYLDQNKWIELARIVNGLESSRRSKQILAEIKAALDSGCIFPLSALHIIEFSRIKNADRRRRLGKVMWSLSKGATTAPLKSILEFEIEAALKAIGYPISPTPLQYIGHGIAHAFGEHESMRGFWDRFSDTVDEAMLCGEPAIQMEPLSYSSLKHRKNFAEHLRKLNEEKRTLEKDKLDDWLYAISMADINEPLSEAFARHKISITDIEGWGLTRLKAFMDAIPTRKLDIHLHRQVLKNDHYKPKESDLEDWAGLGAAACYADAVVCEKHFASLLARDGFTHHARIETKMSKTLYMRSCASFCFFVSFFSSPL